ncbi:MAG TPA: DUF2071 domain-containing protein [Casimicrobiaceae bacterium]|nr:DUF2071 domain-containing protein [Casimicrobiaceae bacterium]
MDRFAYPRPQGPPILHQSWSHLAFMHWPVAPELVRPLLPRGLALETFDGTAWLGLTPFRVSRMRPSLVPALPWVGDQIELNFRTYVRAGDIPGVWFFSLDATNPLAVYSARVGFRLPYFLASMTFERSGRVRRFRSRRTHPRASAAVFEAEWTVEEWLPEAAPETLDHFLLERYWLYASDGRDLWRARIQHERWRLRRAQPVRYATTLFAAHGLPVQCEAPLMHAQREPLHVEIWPLHRVAPRGSNAGAPAEVDALAQ